MADLLKVCAGHDAYGLATQLLRRFGSVARVLNATITGPALDDEAESVALRLVLAARLLVEAGLRETIVGEAVDSLDPDMIQYLRIRFAGTRCEKLLSIFLDQQNRFMHDEFVSEGGVSETKFAARKIFSRAFELGARGMILVHNHPSGVCRPSEADRELTRWLSKTAPAFELVLIDHLIVTTSSAYSMRAGGEI